MFTRLPRFGLVWLGVGFIFLLTACSSPPVPAPATPASATATLPPPPSATLPASPSPSPAPSATPTPRTLTICMGAEPETLYVFGNSMLAQKNILEAIYDGPIDTNSFSYQPVIIEKLPSLADGDALLQAVAVQEGDRVVNDAGAVVSLAAGAVVRSYGAPSPCPRLPGMARRWR